MSANEYEPEGVDPYTQMEIGLLDKIVTQTRVAERRVVVGRKAVVLGNYPYPDCETHVVDRPAVGVMVTLESDTFSLLLSENHHRMGGLIVASKPVWLFLTDTEAGKGSAGILLLPAYGRWDLTLSGKLWTGPVTAQSRHSLNQISIAEV